VNVVADRDVGTGAKAPAGAGDHERAHAAVTTGLVKRIPQRDPQLRVDRVLAVRTVERERPHPIAVI
jgi:hypothetical protein